EREWEKSLGQQRQLKEEFERWKQSTPSQLSEQQREAIRRLAADLPALWQAGTANAGDRKQIGRLLLERGTVVVDKDNDLVNIQLQWMGGVQTEHAIVRPAARCRQRLICRLKELSSQGLSSSQIAANLNAEKFWPTGRAKKFNGAIVLRLTTE